MQTIVVGTDGSPSALNAVEEAARQARVDGATVHVVSAYRNNAGTMLVPEMALVAATDLRPHAEKALADAAARVKAVGVPCETHVVQGPAPEALIGVAETHHARMIVVGSKGMRGKGRLLGSVPNTITHSAGCNVLIVRTD